MVSFSCKECGKTVWETYRGARAETGEIGEDLCDECEERRLDFHAAEQFLKNHYQKDVLDADRIRRDDEHRERVMGNPERFPNADLDFITQFGDAASSYLGGVSHAFAVEI